MPRGVRYDDVIGPMKSELQTVFAVYVRTTLIQRKLSQEWLAEKIGSSQKHISEMMTGKTQGTLLTWQKIFKVLDIRVQLMDDVGQAHAGYVALEDLTGTYGLSMDQITKFAENGDLGEVVELDGRPSVQRSRVEEFLSEIVQIRLKLLGFGLKPYQLETISRILTARDR